jgi:hypothetical protein
MVCVLFKMGRDVMALPFSDFKLKLGNVVAYLSLLSCNFVSTYASEIRTRIAAIAIQCRLVSESL